MDVTLVIPDDVAEHLGSDLSRRALEAFALEEYRAGHLTENELQRLLGFGTRYKLDEFLKSHGILINDYTADDLRAEVAILERLGF